jgi:hypothetical protein
MRPLSIGLPACLGHGKVPVKLRLEVDERDRHVPVLDLGRTASRAREKLINLGAGKDPLDDPQTDFGRFGKSLISIDELWSIGIDASA